LGRFKNIEIQGLLIDDFGSIFMDGINNVIKTSELTEEEVLKKIAPKFEKLISDYEESVSSLYVEKHKFNFIVVR